MEITRKVKNLLWPNDFSKCSEEALPYVRSLAKKYGAIVFMLYIAGDLAHPESWYGEFDSFHVDRVMEWQIKRARAYRKDFCSKHLEDCAAYTTHIAVGNPVKRILEFIEDKQIDMVVMCRRGKTSDFDMGSVALKVIANAPVPVVIAPSSNDK
jgi:nucleotide-binding universal stress UspA family protein